MSTMFTFSIFSAVFMSIGVLLYLMSDQITEVMSRYDDVPECKQKLRDTSTCKVPLGFIENTIEKPIYVYY